MPLSNTPQNTAEHEPQTKNFEDALHKAEQGHPPSQTDVGIMYASGQGVAVDQQQAAKWLHAAAENKDPEGMFSLGVAYSTGIGVVTGLTKAALLFERAASTGHARAQANLGLIYEQGSGVPQDDERAEHWYEQAANQGLAEAQFKLAMLGYLRRVNQAKTEDEQAAASQWLAGWLKKASDQQHDQAMFSLGMLYLDGVGVEKDSTRALDLLHHAAEDGHLMSQVVLGDTYRVGEGAIRNAPKAFKWYHKAAQQGSSHAMLSLSVMLAGGIGVDQDLVAALALALLDKEQGDENQEHTAALKERMAPQDHHQASQKASEWSAHGIPETLSRKEAAEEA